MTSTEYPFLQQKYAAAAATSVFPLPTSPCIRRFIGNSRCISRIQSETARSCAFVGVNGSLSHSSEISTLCMTAPVRSLPRRFISESPSFSVISSSNTSRRLAAVYSSRLRGKCICFTACSRGSSSMRLISPSGSVSGSLTTESAVLTFADTMLLVSPAVRGYFGISPPWDVSTNSGEPICIRTRSPDIFP